MPEDVLRVVKDDNIKTIALRFTDLLGRWQKVEVRSSVLDPESMDRGIAVSKLSMNWIRKIQKGDIWMIPDPSSAFLDPFSEVPTLIMICNIHDPAVEQRYSHDARSIAQRAERYLLDTDIGETARFGLRLEYFLGPRTDNSLKAADTRQGTARVRSYKLRSEVHLPAAPPGALEDIRVQIAATLANVGIKLEANEIGTGGQSKIGVGLTSLTSMADNVMICKYVVENVVARRGMMATFMPPTDNTGSGVSVYQGIWLGERPLFAGDGYAGTAALMRHYIAGLVAHAPALLAICSASDKSLHRLSPSLKAPVNLDYSRFNRSSTARGPISRSDCRPRFAEFRCPGLPGNPYLAFAAMLMAGIDGFHYRLYNVDRDEPLERLTLDELALGLGSTLRLGSTEELRKALEADRAFLLRGDVFKPYEINALSNTIIRKVREPTGKYLPLDETFIA
jgi:glutamine synthetase